MICGSPERPASARGEKRIGRELCLYLTATGQQQVRNIWTNVAVYHLNLRIHTLVELWSWNRAHEKLCDRSLSPWDDAQRRPSHADRRKALRRETMQQELSTLAATGRLPQKILQFAQRLMALAT